MYTESLGQQVSEERIVFGLIADRPSNHTLSELVNTYQYSSYDVSTIAREVMKYNCTCTCTLHIFMCTYNPFLFFLNLPPPILSLPPLPQLSLSDKDEVTPVTLLSNSVLHLIGPARCIGAVVCGYSGIRTFEPQVIKHRLYCTPFSLSLLASS